MTKNPEADENMGPVQLEPRAFACDNRLLVIIVTSR